MDELNRQPDSAEIREELRQIISDVIGADLSGLDDNIPILQYVTSSLALVEGVRRVYERYGVLVPLRDVLERNASLTAISVFLAERLSAGQNDEQSTLSQKQREIPLAASQQHIGFLMRYSAGASVAYSEALILSLDGPLYLPALRGAIEAVAARYEALQASLSRDTDALVIGDEQPLELVVSDCAEEQTVTRIEEVTCTPFEIGARLFRVELLRVSENKHLLALIGHALVVDRAALVTVAQEIAQIFRALSTGDGSSPPPLALQWTEYRARVLDTLAQPLRSEVEAYWKNVFATGVPHLELPSDRPRPAVKTYAGARLEVPLDAELIAQIKKWSDSQGANLFAVLLTAFTTFLHRLSGQNDIVVGIENKPGVVAAEERVVAATVDILPFRSQYDPQTTFRDSLHRNTAQLAEVSYHNRLSRGELIQLLKLTRDQSRSALFSAAFCVQELDEPPSFESLQVSFATMPATGARYDLALTFVTTADHEALFRCDYSTELFDAETITGWIEGIIELVKSGITHTESIGRLPLMSEQQRRRQLSEWNATQTAYPYDRTVLDLFHEQVRNHPDTPAIRSRGEEQTYGQLAARSEAIAQLLWAAGVRPSERVGILLPRSLDLVASFLAAWRVGAVVVPFDRNFPVQRLAFMLSDAAIHTVVTNAQTEKLVDDASGARQLRLDATDLTGVDGVAIPQSNASGCAYVIYTSGSTGKPKGVELGHSGLVSFMLSAQQLLGFTAADSLLAITTVSFDISICELFMPLISGGVLIMGEEGLGADGFRLVQRIETRRPTYVQATPSTWKAVLAAGWTGDKNLCAMAAGEALSRELAEQLVARYRVVWNLYGPSETTIYSAAYRVESAPDTPMRIGRPLPNTQLYILDDQLEPLPIGAVGELYIGGTGVARGYLGRPDLTAEKFVPNPFEPNERIYGTGDLARYLRNGDVECLGRVDHQVKIHGVRVELGEVEAALRNLKDVSDAVVTSWTDSHGDIQLVAHLLASGNSKPKSADIRSQLREQLPEAMIPPYIMFSESFPLTVNGKILRSALPSPDAILKAQGDSSAPPETPTERQLAGAWAKVLGIEVEQIGRSDDFMNLGGHSLLMTQLMVEVRRLFHVSFSLSEFFRASTLKHFGALIDQLRRSRIREPNEYRGHLGIRGPESGEQRMAFLRREAELPASIAPTRGLTFQANGKPSAALLTGATGFLGAYIAAEVLRTTDAHLLCLVRPKHGADSKTRIEQQMRNYEVWGEDEAWQLAWNERVHIVEGDVILPRFGMADSVYESLAGGVDCIIHSAAHVNFIYPYEALKATNVTGVHEIVRFAFHRRIKPVHYLSTAAVWPMGSKNTFFEQDSLEHGQLLNLGYDEAKWVGEKSLLCAAERGLPLARYRPGEVGGDSKTGRCVTNHFIIASLRGFLEYGAFPTIDTLLDIAPVDYVAQSLVHMVFHANPLGRAFHLTNPRQCHMTDALSFLRDHGYQFEERQFEDLRNELVYDPAFARNALFPYQAVLESMSETSLELPTYDCTQTLRELEGTGIVCPAVDNQLLGTYMRYLRGIGYMPEPVQSALSATVDGS